MTRSRVFATIEQLNEHVRMLEHNGFRVYWHEHAPTNTATLRVVFNRFGAEKTFTCEELHWWGSNKAIIINTINELVKDVQKQIDEYTKEKIKKDREYFDSITPGEVLEVSEHDQT